MSKGGKKLPFRPTGYREGNSRIMVPNTKVDLLLCNIVNEYHALYNKKNSKLAYDPRGINFEPSTRLLEALSELEQKAKLVVQSRPLSDLRDYSHDKDYFYRLGIILQDREPQYGFLSGNLFDMGYPTHRSYSRPTVQPNRHGNIPIHEFHVKLLLEYLLRTNPNVVGFPAPKGALSDILQNQGVEGLVALPGESFEIYRAPNLSVRDKIKGIFHSPDPNEAELMSLSIEPYGVAGVRKVELHLWSRNRVLLVEYQPSCAVDLPMQTYVDGLEQAKVLQLL